MPDPLTDPSVTGTNVVSAGGVAARQIEGFLARHHVAEGQTAWLAPTVLSYRDWADDMWRRYLDDGSRQLLSPGQVDALWRRVIDESATGFQGLPGYRHVSAWAREASQRRRDWNIASEELHAFRDDPDCRAFLRWERAYREALDESGWLDSEDVVADLVARAPSPSGNVPASVVWADLTLTPVQLGLAERLRDAGFQCSSWAPSHCNQRCRRIQLPESADEIRVAAAWAAARLSRQSRQRVAIVVPGLETRREEVVDVLEDSLSIERSQLSGHAAQREVVCLQGQSTAMDNPVIGAAMNALELFSDAADFPVLSRWLRSPFFGTADETDARCMLEAQLRSHISSQMNFVDAFNSGGLSKRIRATIPALAEVLGAAVSLMDAQPRRATLTGWVSVWRRLLGELEWCGNDSTVPEDWETALNDLMFMTPILGGLSLSDALLELERILARPQRVGALPLFGVFVLSNPEDVGPGYDAVWVCGLTDTQWPRAPQPIPLLPFALQRSHGMPSATPAAAFEHSRITIRRLVGRVPDVVLSWPDVVHEHSVQPSPLIQSYPVVTEGELVGSRARRSWLGPADGSRLETRADPVPPVANREVRGGIGTLSMHSICPLRAFIDSRLQAEPLETVRPGLSARQRGIAAHASVRRLLSDRPDQQELQSWTTEDRLRRVNRSCYLALRVLFGEAQTRLGALFELELARLQSMLTNFLEVEAARSPFRVIALEHSIQVTVGGLELRGRIDRIDEVGSAGGFAVIDYKTGTRNNPSDWLRARPRELQLPFYASSIEGELEAVVIAVLNTRSSAYKGFWLTEGRFPGRVARLPADHTLSMQRDRWRALLDELAQEFAKGDGRIFLRDLRQAGGVIAPLTRIHELTALARKSDS